MRKLSRNEWIAVTAAVLVVGYSLFGGSVINGMFGSSSQVASIAMSDENGANQMNNTMNTGDGSGVGIEDIIIGSGSSLEQGMMVAVNYVLKLQDGTVIQDSKLVGAGQPFEFVYGVGQLIPGWEMGIATMKVGGKRVITIPPTLGYGAQQVGPIPANSTLVFEIEVLSARQGN